MSCFESDGPRIGDPAFAAMHDSQVCHSTSDDERARFEADPVRYVPVFSAFCAYNGALGRTTPIDPTKYKIVGASSCSSTAASATMCSRSGKRIRR